MDGRRPASAGAQNPAYRPAHPPPASDNAFSCGTRALRPGPTARGKWLAGSVRRDPGEVIAAAFDEAAARDPA
ncbi:MAG: hypothetical protein QOJ73_6464 [Streptosporangiaceae bacterium]|jgi:hypothetical protein|nr:hypothetical protein [Streptosporangiaceae bacterium]